MKLPQECRVAWRQAVVFTMSAVNARLSITVESGRGSGPFVLAFIACPIMQFVDIGYGRVNKSRRRGGKCNFPLFLAIGQ